MPATIIKHKRGGVYHHCDHVDIHLIELVDTRYRVNAVRGRDIIQFVRQDDEFEKGFVVNFEETIGGGKEFIGNRIVGDTCVLERPITVHSKQAEGDYKYTISYPDDTPNVVPLDPIIIIQRPRAILSLSTFVVGAVAFVAGAAAASMLLN